jgi:serine/threonine-protein kinase HipA
VEKIDVIKVFFGKDKVGRIALTEHGLCAFEYDAEFLKTGFSLSPYHLPLRTGVFIAPKTPFRGGFGVFDDSLPDGWGSLLLDRYLHSKGIEPEKLSILQRLALVGTMGNLHLTRNLDLLLTLIPHAIAPTSTATHGSSSTGT